MMCDVVMLCVLAAYACSVTAVSTFSKLGPLKWVHGLNQPHAHASLHSLPNPRIDRSLLSLNSQLWEEAHADGGLPPKPKSKGPDSAAWSNSVGVCSLIKDENATDVREWVLYYRYAYVSHGVQQ